MESVKKDVGLTNSKVCLVGVGGMVCLEEEGGTKGEYEGTPLYGGSSTTLSSSSMEEGGAERSSSSMSSTSSAKKPANTPITACCSSPDMSSH